MAEEINININDNTSKQSKSVVKSSTRAPAGTAGVNRVKSDVDKLLKKLESSLGKSLAKELIPLIKPLLKKEPNKNTDISKLDASIRKMAAELIKIASKKDTSKAASDLSERVFNEGIKRLETVIGKKFDAKTVGTMREKVSSSVSGVLDKDVIRVIKDLTSSLGNITKQTKGLSDSIKSLNNIRKDGISIKETTALVSALILMTKEHKAAKAETAALRKSISELKDSFGDIVKSMQAGATSIQSGIGSSYRRATASAQEDPTKFTKTMIGEITKNIKTHLPKEIAVKILPKLEKIDNFVELKKVMEDIAKVMSSLKGEKFDVKGLDAFMKSMQKTLDYAKKLEGLDLFGVSGKELSKSFDDVYKKVKGVVDQLKKITDVTIKVNVDTSDVKKQITTAVGDATKGAVTKSIKGSTAGKEIEKLMSEFAKIVKEQISIREAEIKNKKDPAVREGASKGVQLFKTAYNRKDYTQMRGSLVHIKTDKQLTEKTIPAEDVLNKIIGKLAVDFRDGTVAIDKQFKRLAKNLGIFDTNISNTTKDIESSPDLSDGITAANDSLHELKKAADDKKKELKNTSIQDIKPAPTTPTEPPRKQRDLFAQRHRSGRDSDYALKRAPGRDMELYKRSIIKPVKDGITLEPSTGIGADVIDKSKRRVSELSKSLDELQDFIIDRLESGLGKQKYSNWAIIKKNYENKQEAISQKQEFFRPSGGTVNKGGTKISKEWKIQIADVSAMEKKLGKKLQDSYGGSVAALTDAYKNKLIEDAVAATRDTPEEMSRLVGRWLKMTPESQVRGAGKKLGMGAGTIDRVIKEKQKEANRKAQIVTKTFTEEIENIFGEDLENVFKQTWVDFNVSRKMTGWRTTKKGKQKGPVVKSLTIPAAQISKTGGTMLETQTGSERSLSKFATYISGFEQMFKKIESNKDFKRSDYGDIPERIRQTGGISPKNLTAANKLSKDLLIVHRKLGGTAAMDDIKGQYRTAATSRGVKLARAGVTTVSDFEEKINEVISSFEAAGKSGNVKPLTELIKSLDEVGVSAYDAVRALDKVEFENIYDIYKKILKGSPGLKQPLKSVSESPKWDKPFRDFQKAVRQVEQLMPITSAERPRRGVHQENVVQTMLETSNIYSKVKQRSPQDQKNVIKDLNIRLDELVAERRALKSGDVRFKSQRGEKAIRLPEDVRTLSSLGIPESPASSYVELRKKGKDVKDDVYSEGTEYLKTLGATSIKMYSDDLTELAPYAKQFTQAGRNIASVTNAMSSSARELKNKFGKFDVGVEGRGTEFPALRTQRERELIGSGRYGSKGYGFNVMAELRSTANTFEDQIVISGKLADALTQSVKTLIKPSEGGRLGRDGSLAKDSGVVSDIKAKVLVDEDKVSSVMKEYQDILGFPEKYSGRADKALIDEVEKVLTVVRSSDVEVQTAKLAEVFLGHFGRKFTTRYGSKGVSVSPTASFKVRQGEGLGKAVVPKSMGQLIAEILEKESPEAAKVLKTKLINSGNKFIIDLFTDASKGLTIPEEASTQKGIFTQAKGALSGIVDLQQGTKGISELKKQYKSIVGGQLVEEVPIDIRISAHGAAKRGLQPEVLEMITNNLIRGGSGAQTTMKTELDESVYKTLLGGSEGSLSSYSKSLGYKSAGMGKDKISTMEEGFAKRAAELEEQSNFYSKVIDEFGKERTGLVGEKFVSIVKEPHAEKGWKKSDINKGAKGIGLNIPAFSAYSTVFGKDSELMKSIRERSSSVDAEQWEYIKTFLATSTSKAGENYMAELAKGLDSFDVSDVDTFTMHTGTFDPADQRSLKGTVLDVEKFYKPFMIDLPKTTGFEEMGERESFYVPGPLARGVYPEPTIAGEYGSSVVPRRLQHIVNMAHEALGELEKGEQLAAEIEEQRAAFPHASDNMDAAIIHENIKKAETAYDNWKTGKTDLTNIKMAEVFPTSLRTEVESVISSGDMVKMADMANRFAAVIHEFGSSMSGTRPSFDKQTVEDMAKELRLAMDLVIGPKNLEENLEKVKEGLKLISEGETVESSEDLLEISKMPALEGFTQVKKKDGLEGKLRAFKSATIGKKPRGIIPVLEHKDVDDKYKVAETLGISGKMGLTIEERYAEQLTKLERAKIDYYNELARVVMGKKGAIAESIFTRKIPSVMAYAVNAVVDKRKEFAVFGSRLNEIYSKYGDISGVGLKSISDISETMGEISKTHAKKITDYKASGLPVLKERELGVPAELAKKLPVTFKKRFKAEEGVEGQLRAVPIKTTEVKGTLFDMLEYKQSIEKSLDFMNVNTRKILEKHIEEELVPYIESVRFPFTGTSSLQPYKAKLLPEMIDPKTGVDLTKHSLMVPGMPDMDFDSFNEQKDKISEIITKASEERERLRGPEAREPGSEESSKASEKIERLTNLINDLNRALTDVIPKYIAVQQKLDFDGDTIQIHSDTVDAARRDIKKHYDDFGKDLNSISTTWARKFTSESFDPITGEFPLSDMMASFEKKFPTEKGFEFLKKPFLTRDLEYLKPEQQLNMLSDVSKKDMQSLLDELVKKGVRGTALVGKTGMTDVETSADVISKIINTVKKPAEGEGDYGAALLKSLQDFDAKFNTQVYALVKEELRESVFSSKFKDAIEAQLYKLHVGTDTEALNRIQALIESKIGFGKEGMLSGTAGQDFKDTHAMMNELYRFGTQKGMDVKHAGETPVAGEIVRMLSKGEVGKLWKGIQTDDTYKQLKEFTETISETIRARAGEQTTPQLRKTLEEVYMKAGKPTSEIPVGRENMIEDLVDLKGFKGFLESIFNQIKEEAIKGMMSVEGYTEEKAVGELQKLLTPGRDREAYGVNINRYITQPKSPLYGFRTASANPRSKMYEYEKKHGKLDVPEFAYSGSATKRESQEKSFVSSYKEAEATAASLRESLSMLSKDQGKGAYSEMIRSTIDNLYKDQAIIEAILSQTKTGESQQKTLTQGLQIPGSDTPIKYDLSAFTQKSPLTPSDINNLEVVMKELSRLAGIPSLTREEKKAIRIKEEERGVGKEAQSVISKSVGKSVDEFDTGLQERAEIYKDLLIRKAEAQKQFEKAMSSIESKAGEGKALMGLIPKKGAVRTITRDYDKFRGLIPEASKKEDISERKHFPSHDTKVPPPGSGGTPPTGMSRPPKDGEVLKVYIVGAAPGIFGDGTSGSVYTGRKLKDQESAARAMSDLGHEDPLGAFQAQQEDFLNGMKFSPGGGGGYSDYLKAQPVAAGMGTDAAFSNLKRLHSLAKDFQRQLGISKETTLKGMPKQYSDITKDLKRAEAGDITGKEFYETIDRLKKEEGLSFRDSVKAWKLYRIAIGDFLLRQAEEAKMSMEEADASGRTDEAAEQYKIYNDTVSRLKKLIESTAGKKSDIYTFDKQWISPEVAYAAGVYKTPEQIAKQASKPLGEDEKLKELYDKIIKDFTSGKQPTAPIEKARSVFRSLSDMNDEIIDLLVDAEQFKRVGSEIDDAWDLDSLINDVSRLRAALDMFAKQNLAEDMDVTARKNLEETIKYLKNIENMYASISNKRDVKPSWGETGVVKVPKWETPEKQLALHRRNTAKIEEYMRRPAAEGGAKIGERQSYSMKVFGEAGEVIKNSIVNFHKYGEGVNAAGQKVGQMSKRVEDLTKRMQVGNRSFRAALKRVVMWGGAASIVYGGVSKLQDSIELIGEVETKIAELRMVMSSGDARSFEKLQTSAVGFAKQYGVPVTEILRSMKIFAQQGLKQGEVIDRTQTATLASNVTTLSAADATEALTAAMKIYRQEGESSIKFLDAWSEVEARHAITAGDMADALKKAASAAKNAGVDFHELNGIVAAIGSVTRQSGKEVGTSLRFIFRRLSSEKGPTELGKLGIPVVDNKELRSGFDILNDLAMQWDELTSSQRMNVAQAIGGTRQYNSLLVLMQNWDEALDAIKDSTNSKGSAERRNLELMKTYEKQLQQTAESANKLKLEFGKVYLPIAKFSLKGLRTFMEIASNIPTTVKAASVAVGLLFTYLAKGSDIIDNLVNRFRSGKSVVGEFASAVSGDIKAGMYESFGKGDESDPLLKNLNRIGKEGGTSLDKFHSSLGKSIFMLTTWGRSYNKFLTGMGKDVGGGIEGTGTSVRKLGNMLDNFVDPLQTAAAANDLSAGEIGPLAFIDNLLLYSAEAGAKGSEAVGLAMEKIGSAMGKGSKDLAESWVGSNTDIVKSIAPLLTTMVGLGFAGKKLHEVYGGLIKTASGYEKSMYNVKRVDEEELKNIRDLIGSYDTLDKKLATINRSRDSKVKERQQELGTYKSPILEMSSFRKKSIELGNRIAESNINMISGYDKLGNAVLKTSGSFKTYLSELEKIKVKDVIKTDLKVLEKYIYDLTETVGNEKLKHELKEFVEEIPLVGEMLSKGINVSPAKVLDMGVSEVNKLISKKGEYPLTTAFDKDIKELQKKIRKFSDSYKAVYGDFKRVLSDMSTKGLDSKEITDIFNTEYFKKGFKLMIEIEPELQIAKDVNWEDLMGHEVMKRVYPELASSSFAATAELTKANIESMGIRPREDKVRSGDIVTFDKSRVNLKNYSYYNDLNMAGDQARVTLKKGIDDTYEWVATYFNTKTLEIEERPFDKDMQSLVNNILPLNSIKEDLSERMDSLNEFVAGAAAGLRGITPKDFKRDLNLGERFFSDIATTTVLQGSKGFTPGASSGFGESPFQKGWGESFKEYYAKPAKEYKMQLEQLQKMRLEGLDGGKVTLATGLYEELSKLQDVLKNNQVVLQYRAAFVDLTKTLEQGMRTLQEAVVIEKDRQRLDKNVGGYMSGITTGLENINLGNNKFSSLSPIQRSLIESPKQRQTIKDLLVSQTKSRSAKEGIDSINRALVAVNNISQVSKGFETSLSPDDLKKYTEVIAKTGDVGVAELVIETGHVVSNTADTVDRLDTLIENQSNSEELEDMLSSWTDLLTFRNPSTPFGAAAGVNILPTSRILEALNRVGNIRNIARRRGDDNLGSVANKALDKLSKELVDRVGIKEGARLVEKRSKIGLVSTFSKEEFQQRALQGLNLETFLDKIQQQPGFKGASDVEKLKELQKEESKKPLVSSKEIIKLQAAFVAYSAIQKKSSSVIIDKLNTQIKTLEKNIADAREAGSPEEVLILKKELETTKLAKEQEQRKLSLYKMAQTLTVVSGSAMMFAKSMGFSEKQIKLLGVGAIATYGALKVASKAAKTDMPEFSKEFGNTLKEVSSKVLSGEELSTKDKSKVVTQGKSFIKEYNKNLKETLTTSAKETKEKYVGTTRQPTEVEKDIIKKREEAAAGEERTTQALIGAGTAYVSGGYLAKKSDEETRVADLEANAKEQRKVVNKIISENSKQTQAVIDSMREDKKKIQKVAVETESKSLVLDTDKERKKTIKNLNNIKKDYEEGYKKEIEYQKKADLKASKTAILFKIKTDVEGFDEAINSIEELSKLQDKFLSKQTSKKAFGLMAGKYKPQAVDFGIQDIRDMTTGEFASFTSEKTADKFKKLEVYEQQLATKTDQLTEVYKQIKELESKSKISPTGLSDVEQTELDALKVVMNNLETEFNGLTTVVTDARVSLKDDFDIAGDALRDFKQVIEGSARRENAAYDRVYGQRQVLNKNLVGFSGEVDLPSSRLDFSPQEFAYTSLIKKQKDSLKKVFKSVFTPKFWKSLVKGDLSVNLKEDNRAAEFKNSMASYADALKSIDAMRERVKSLMEERRAVLVNSERYNQLTSQIVNTNNAMNGMIENVRKFGETANIVFKLSAALQEFERSSLDFIVAQQSANTPGMREFEDKMSKIVGGSHPLAQQWVSPMEKASYYGMVDSKATQYEIKEADLKKRIWEGDSSPETLQELLMLPKTQKQDIEKFKQQESVATLEESQSRFIQLREQLYKVKATTPGLTDEQSSKIEEGILKIEQLLNRSMTTPGTKELISESKRRYKEGEITKEEYKEEVSEIKKAGESQFADFSVGGTKEINSMVKEIMTEIAASARAVEETSMSKAINPVVTELQTHTDLLRQIADNEMNLSPEGQANAAIDRLGHKLDDKLEQSGFYKNSTTKKASGGRVFGEGGPREDRIPAYLSNGEFVMRAAAAQKIGYGNLEVMNKKGAVPAFAEGGSVFKRTADYMEASTESMKKERKDLVSGYLKTGKRGMSKQLELATTETIGSIIKYGAEFGDLVTSGGKTTSKVLGQIGKEGTSTGLFDVNTAVQGWKKAIGFAKVLGNLGYSETAKTLNQVAKEGSATGLFDVKGAKEGYSKFLASETGKKVKEAATYNIPEATAMIISSIAGEGVSSKLLSGGKKLTQLKSLGVLDESVDLTSVLDGKIDDFVYDRLLVKSDITGKESTDKFLKLQKSGKIKGVKKSGKKPLQPMEHQIEKSKALIAQREKANLDKFGDKIKEIQGPDVNNLTVSKTTPTSDPLYLHGQEKYSAFDVNTDSIYDIDNLKSIKKHSIVGDKGITEFSDTKKNMIYLENIAKKEKKKIFEKKIAVNKFINKNEKYYTFDKGEDKFLRRIKPKKTDHLFVKDEEFGGYAPYISKTKKPTTVSSYITESMEDVNASIVKAADYRSSKIGKSDYEHYMSQLGIPQGLVKSSKQVLSSKKRKPISPQPRKIESWDSFVKRQEKYFKDYEKSGIDSRRKNRESFIKEDLTKRDLYDTKHLSLNPEKQLSNFEEIYGKNTGLNKLRTHLDNITSGNQLSVEGTPGFTDKVVFHEGAIVNDHIKPKGMEDWYDLQIQETIGRAKKVKSMVGNVSKLKPLKKADGGYIGDKFRNKALLEKKKKYIQDNERVHGHQFNIKKAKENQERLLREFGYSAAYTVGNQAADESYYRFTETPEDKPTYGSKRKYSLAGHDNKKQMSKEDMEFNNFVDRITAIENEAKNKKGSNKGGIYNPRREIRSAQWSLGRKNKLFEGQKGLDVDYDTWITKQGLSTAEAEYGSGYPGAPKVDDIVRATRSEIFESKNGSLGGAKGILNKEKAARYFTDAYGGVSEVTGEQYSDILSERKGKFFTDARGGIEKVNVVDKLTGKTDLEKTLELYEEIKSKRLLQKKDGFSGKKDSKITDLVDMKVVKQKGLTSFGSKEKDDFKLFDLSPDNAYRILSYEDLDRGHREALKDIMSDSEDKTINNKKEKNIEARRKMTDIIKDSLKHSIVTPKGMIEHGKGMFGAAEGITSLVSGLFSTLYGGLGSISIKDGLLSGDIDRSNEFLSEIQEKYTYNPRTEAGKELLSFAIKPFELLHRFAEYAGDKVHDTTGQHVLGSTTASVIESLPLLLPIKRLKAGKYSPKKAPEIPKLSKIVDEPTVAFDTLGTLQKSSKFTFSKLLKLLRVKSKSNNMKRIFETPSKIKAMMKKAAVYTGVSGLRIGSSQSLLDAGTSSLLGASQAFKGEKSNNEINKQVQDDIKKQKQKEIQDVTGRIDKAISNPAIINKPHSFRSDSNWNADTLMALEKSINNDLIADTSSFLKTSGYGDVGMGTNLYSTDKYGKRVGDINAWMENRKKSFKERQAERKELSGYKRVQSAGFIGNIPKGIEKLRPHSAKSVPTEFHQGPKYATSYDRLMEVKERLDFINSEKGKKLMSDLEIPDEMVSNLNSFASFGDKRLLKNRPKIDLMYSMVTNQRDSKKRKGVLERWNKALGNSMGDWSNRTFDQDGEFRVSPFKYDFNTSSEIESLIKKYVERYGSGGTHSLPVFHNGGEVRKTGPIFAQKGELVIPKLADGSTGINAMVSSDAPANKSVNASIKLDLTELKSLLDDGISLETNTVKLESDVVKLPDGTTVEAVLADNTTVRLAEGETVEAVLSSDARVEAVLAENSIVSVDTSTPVKAILDENVTVKLDPDSFVKVDPNTTVTAIVDTSEIELTTKSVTLDAREAVAAISNALSDITVNVSGSGDGGAASAKINTAVENMLSVIGNLEEKQSGFDNDIKMLNEKTEQTSVMVSDLSSKIYESIGSMKTEIYNSVSTKVDGLRSSVAGIKNFYDSTINELNIKISMALNNIGKF